MKGLSEKGFSLLEIMMVLILMGFLVSGFLGAMQVYNAEKKETQMDKTYDSVRAAMNGFIQGREGTDIRARYPCPAPLNVGPNSAEFGKEQRKPDGTCDATTDGSNGVYDVGTAYIGAIPTNTLGITSEFMLDNFGNKMTYAVTQSHVLDFALTTTPVGQVEIIDESGSSLMAPFALVTHGQDGAGAYTIEGATYMPCRSSVAADGENCDFDDAKFKESRTKLGSSTDFYDDRLAFSLVDDDDDEWWGPVADSPNDIRNKNPGLVCVGDSCDPAFADPADRLLVDGSARMLGDVIAIGLVSSGTHVIAGRDVQARRDVLAEGDVSAQGDVISENMIRAEQAVTAGNVDVASVSRGDIAAKNDVSAENDVSAARDVLAERNLRVEGKAQIGESPPSAATLGVHGYVKIVNGALEIDTDGDDNWGSIYNSDDTTEGLVISAKKKSNKREDIVIHENGKVGIGGVEVPNTALDVAGEVKVGNSGAVCNAGRAGAVRYDTSGKVLQLCDGTSWRALLVLRDNMVRVVKSTTRGSITTASCPSGTIRVGCAGTRDEQMRDTHDEEDGGFIGARPTGTNGCQAAMDPAGSNVLAVWAFCLDPTGSGGTDTGTTTGGGTGDETITCGESEVPVMEDGALVCRSIYGGSDCAKNGTSGNSASFCKAPSTAHHGQIINGTCGGHSAARWAGMCTMQCFDGVWQTTWNACVNDDP